MKKIFLAAFALAATVGTASAQVEIGLKVSPTITSLRAESTSKNGFASDGSQLGFSGGLVVDYFFGENYAFSTGLELAGKGGTVRYTDFYNNGNGVGNAFQTSYKMSTQYLQLPLSVKLFTNEIAPATRLYFQVGGSLNVPIGTRINSSKFYTDPATGTENKAGDYVYFFDADALLGAGAEYALGSSTKLFAGLGYHRGLVDIDHYFESKRNFTDVTIKNSSFGLDLGIKF
ncbi:porin family protein [Hymenobacter sp. M29]|uniref:Porin family protein n=1 Tax=Hymenobacter mellowenesis TaxID=3063995 RepID=A0ABT9AEQ7_9BACT|nr:porin family protein [Hymenobacter sp. M29]MDO7848340.1 porin family protein [Hymenobacter sp. M29]